MASEDPPGRGGIDRGLSGWWRGWSGGVGGIQLCSHLEITWRYLVGNS